MDSFRIAEGGELIAYGGLEGESQASQEPPPGLVAKDRGSSCPHCARNGAPYDHDSDGSPRDSVTVAEPLQNLGPEPLDALRYIASNPDLVPAFGTDAEAGRQHYINFGQAEGRRVDSFSAFRYGASHPDLINAYGADAQALTLHYLQAGFREGRSTAAFDPLNYAAANIDLLQALGRNADALARHYVQFGFHERRSIDFDGLSYAAANPDLARVFGSNEDALLAHYLDHGFGEGRRTSGFDALRYASSNPDLARAFGTDVASLTSHYVNFGARENRSTDSFDALIYGASNPDLARAFGPDASGLTLHYLRFGVNEARPTNAFDRVAYILSNPDLASAGVGVGGAANHWISFGLGEGRTASGQFGLEQTSHALNASGQVAGAHATAGDRDWYQVSLNSGQLVTVRLTPDDPQQDAFLRVYDGSGRLLFSANNMGAGAAETITFTAPSTGAFYLVTGSAGDVGAGTYTLGLTTNALPVITSAATASVAENTEASTIVYQATATDADGETLVFSLGGTDAASFTIDAASGAVRLRAPADFETKQSYSFSVTATDPNGQRTSRDVTLSITDVADTSPPPPPPPAGVIGPTPIFFDAEANDGVATAQRLDRELFRVDTSNANLDNAALPSATFRGTISTISDRDFISFHVNAGERINLDIDATTAPFDALIRVFGPDGVELSDNDDAERALDPGSTSRLDSHGAFRAGVTGTYYIVIESYRAPDGTGTTGTYDLNISIGPPVTAAQIQEEDIQLLMSGVQWNSSNLTFGFPQAASEYTSGSISAAEMVGFVGFNVAQQAAVYATLNEIAFFSNLSFTEVISTRGSANLRYAMADIDGAAYAYLPTGGLRDGTSWYSTAGTTFDSPVRGGYAYMTILHETGHALGLRHPHELSSISPGHDSLQYTVMTYRAYIGDPIADGRGYPNETFGFAQSFMMYDIAALQRMYGADFNANAGDTVYSWNPNTGQMTINGVGQAAPGANRILLTVWDGNGNDTYDLSNYASNTTIDLRPGEFTTTSQVQLANLGNGNYATGNIGNALLFNGDTRSLIENAVGGAGNDVLIANQAVNRLTGGGGADTFRWFSAGDSAPGAADRILDFQSGLDRIDLSGIDADSRTAADDAFRFVGSAAFSGSAGELRVETGGGVTRILGDVNGDGVADFELILDNAPLVQPSDFNF